MFEDILILGGFSCGFIFIIGFGIWIFKITKKQRKELKNSPPKEINLDEPPTEPTVKKVKVINQFCETKVVGIKQLEAVEEFIITFEEPDGNIFNLPVPKECYDGFETGQKGLLSIIDGKLYGFELEE